MSKEMGKSQSQSIAKKSVQRQNKLQKQRKRHLARNLRHKSSASGTNSEADSCLGESIPETTAVEPLATHEPVDVSVTSAGEMLSEETLISPSTSDENVARSDYYYEDVEDFWRALDKRSDEFWKRCEQNLEQVKSCSDFDSAVVRWF